MMKSIEERYRELYKAHRELQDELRTLQLSHGKLSSDDQSWLQMKVASQRKMLDTLNRKVLSQRFRLRMINELGRDLTKEEYEAAKEELTNEQVKERIEDYAAIA
jgi:glucan biosynthesis protein